MAQAQRDHGQGSERRAGMPDQAATLARRAATHASLDHPGAVARLLGKLQEAGANDQVTTLLARDPATQVALDDPGAMSRLRQVKAHDHVTAPAERLPAATQSDFLFGVSDHRERHRYGREPDGSVAAPWTWEDLD